MANGRYEWVVGWWSEGLSVVTSTIELIDLIGLPEMDTYENDVLVERVVGQYYVQNLETASVMVLHTRLACRETNGDGETAVINLTLFDDARESFMWHKVHILDQGTNFGARNMFSAAHPEWSHIDCKVNRKMSDLQCLRFHFQTMLPAVITEGFTWGAWIRVLIKH